MARSDEDMEEPGGAGVDRSLWRRCRAADAPDDEGAWLLDLAAFADRRLDPDERDRVAALLARDAACTADVAAARAIAGGVAEPAADLERVVARASALVPRAAPEGARIVGVVVPMRRRMLRGVAQWGSLAAAIAMTSWLGFAMGSDAGLAFAQPGPPAAEGLLNELIDPGIGIARDLGEGAQT